MREVAPPGIYVGVDGAMIIFTLSNGWSMSGTFACTVLHNPAYNEGTSEERLVQACWRALDDFQDFVDENTTEPWPGTTRVPPPGAAFDRDEIVLLVRRPGRSRTLRNGHPRPPGRLVSTLDRNPSKVS